MQAESGLAQGHALLSVVPSQRLLETGQARPAAEAQRGTGSRASCGGTRGYHQCGVATDLCLHLLASPPSAGVSILRTSLHLLHAELHQRAFPRGPRRPHLRIRSVASARRETIRAVESDCRKRGEPGGLPWAAWLGCWGDARGETGLAKSWSESSLGRGDS